MVMDTVCTVNSVLQILLKTTEYVSLKDISQKLGISVLALHRELDRLSCEGYTIDLQSNCQVKLLKPYPFSLILEQVDQQVSADIFDLFFVKECLSTNVVAQEFIMLNDKPLVLFTRNQLSGKGRLDKSWQMTTDKDIAMSFASPLCLNSQRLFLLTMMAALSVLTVLNQYTDQCMIKWPNDIITKDGKKVCGILTETVLESSMVTHVVIGVGVNINSTELPIGATSLCQILQHEVDINFIHAQLISEFSNLWQKFPCNSLDISQNWKENIAWVGSSVMLQQEAVIYSGTLKSVSNDGAIILDISGQLHQFVSGTLTISTL